MLGPTNGFALVKTDDPTGNGMDALGLVFIDANGAVKNCGVHVVMHNSDGPQLVLGSADTDPAYTTTDAPTVVTIPGQSLVIFGS